MKRVCKFISDHMGVLVLLSAVAALLFPEVLGHLKPRLINPLLGVIMFGMGLTLRTEDFKVVFSRPRDVIVGCVAQFTVMPLLAFALTRIFRLEEALHNVFGLGAGYLIGTLLHLETAKRRAISIEVGMQNSGLASSLATLHFATYPLAAIPGALFSVWHNVSGAILAWLFGRK